MVPAAPRRCQRDPRADAFPFGAVGVTMAPRKEHATRYGLFSVSYAGLWGQATLDAEGFVHRAADLGFAGVLFMAKPPHLAPRLSDDAALDRLRGVLDRRGVACIGLAAYTDFLLPAPAEIPAAEMQALYVEACARAAARLGGTLVRIFTGYDRGTLSAAEQESRVARAIRDCAERAESHGITLAVQNHHDVAVDTRAMLALLDAVDRPNVKAGYDAWSPYLRGEDLESGARLMAPRMALTIAADYLRVPRYRYEPSLVNYRREEPDAVKATTMGEGCIDYPAFFRGLRAGGYDGWVVYEMCSPVAGGGAMENLDAKARAFLSYMRARSV
jgi:sugar phosphate isomerase/epimerase